MYHFLELLNIKASHKRMIIKNKLIYFKDEHINIIKHNLDIEQ